jgi:hypothetical protein
MKYKSETEKQQQIAIQKETEFRQLGYLVYSCYDTILLGETITSILVPSAKIQSSNPFNFDAQLWFISSLKGICDLLTKYKNKHTGYKKLYDTIDKEIKISEIVRIRNLWAHFQEEFANSLKPQNTKSINIDGFMTLSGRGSDFFASMYSETNKGIDLLICGTISVKKCIEVLKACMTDIVKASTELQRQLMQEVSIAITMPNGMTLTDDILKKSFKKMVVVNNNRTLYADIPTQQGQIISIPFSEVVSVSFK